MANGLIKIKDKYFEWSTIVDAPVSNGMNLKELETYVKEKYGNSRLENLPYMLKTVDKTGTSFAGEDLNSMIICNRAGENEKNISAEEIYEKYK